MNAWKIRLFALGIIIAFRGDRACAQMQGEGSGQCRCIMCGREWNCSYDYFPAIPDSLRPPKNRQWIKHLDGLLKRERFALAQYRREPEIYRLHTPYTVIIPQKQSQVEWITALFPVLGMKIPDSTGTPSDTASWHDVLQVSMNLERLLIREYEWLVQNTENEKTRRVLSDFLYQTRMHYIMFQHALSIRGLLRAKQGELP
jgi:hypothetical protein